MRTMPTHLGTTGDDRRAKGLPEVQESLLEHSTEETASQDAQGLTAFNRDTSLLQSNPRCQGRVVRTLEALNALGVALADHNHRWSKKERRLYFGAYRWLTSVCGVGSAASG
jgi:hypothetical protein